MADLLIEPSLKRDGRRILSGPLRRSGQFDLHSGCEVPGRCRAGVRPHRRLRYQLSQRPNGDVAAHAATSPAGVGDRGATLAVDGFDNRDTDEAAPRTQNADLSHDFLPALRRWLRDLLIGE